MTRKLYHPLWTHLPAVAVVLLMVFAVLRAMPLPQEAPVHFGIGGQPDRYGSPWEVFGTTIGLSLAFIVLSVILDDLWARQENRKTFNWLSLLDEIAAGVMGGAALAYAGMLAQEDLVFRFSWPAVPIVIGCAVSAGVVLELVRPYIPGPDQVAAEDTSALEEAIAKRVSSGQTWAYWETQNPAWMTALIVLAVGGLLFGTVVYWSTAPWTVAFMLIPAALLVLMYGGLRVVVTPDRVVVRLGVLGIRLLRLKTADITQAEVHRFSPLRDFGGYGIRGNREMKAYFLRGTRGVLITTTQGKKYLIGSDHADRLAAAVRAVVPAADQQP